MPRPARLIPCLALTAGLLLLPLLWRCLLPFLLAGLLAAVMERPVNRLTALGLKRPLAAAAVLLVGLTVVCLILWLAVSRLSYELGRFLLQLPALCSGLLENSRLQEKIYAFVVAAPVPMQQWLQATLDNLLADGLALPEQLYGAMTDAAADFAAALPLWLLSLVTGLLAAYYCSADWPAVKGLLSRLVPAPWRDRLSWLARQLRAALGIWLKTQGWLMLVTFVQLLTGFVLLGIPYALLAACAGALVDALPFFGSGTLLLPWALVVFLQGESPWGLLLLYGVTWLTRTVLEPRLMGRQAGVPPLLSLAAMYAGFRLLGVWGLLLAPLAVFLAAQTFSAPAI